MSSFDFIFAVLSLLDELFDISFLASNRIISVFYYLFPSFFRFLLLSFFLPFSFFLFPSGLFLLFLFGSAIAFSFCSLRSYPYKFRLYLKVGETRDPLQWCLTGEIMANRLSQGRTVNGFSGVRT